MTANSEVFSTEFDKYMQLVAAHDMKIENILSKIVWDALYTREYDYAQIQFDMRNQQHVYALFHVNQLVEAVFEDCQNAIDKWSTHHLRMTNSRVSIDIEATISRIIYQCVRDFGHSLQTTRHHITQQKNSEREGHSAAEISYQSARDRHISWLIRECREQIKSDIHQDVREMMKS